MAIVSCLVDTNILLRITAAPILSIIWLTARSRASPNMERFSATPSRISRNCGMR